MQCSELKGLTFYRFTCAESKLLNLRVSIELEFLQLRGYIVL